MRMRMPALLLVGVFVALICPSVPAADPVSAPALLKREVREMHGWQVQVDARLLGGPDAELGKQVLRVLDFKLYEITQLVAQAPLAKLKKVGIVLDLDYPGLKVMQYHPSAAWLKQHDHDPKLAKMVHIPRARELTGRHVINQQPMVVLHELAHGYHDQVLGFEEPRIREAWEKFKESGKGDRVLHISGRLEKHYGLTTPMEFFAEMTEAYFGTNDFYPFVRAELKKELPDVHQLLEDIWGKLP
ncbi:hypothetical protein AYO44_13225 [Planctomycetaceae bacterium SCGC AG-212-F19]|nr:hypothetical protein AYO44_13225 [Planctomycetaceae bacterium SCGC AG-212-F19]